MRLRLRALAGQQRKETNRFRQPATERGREQKRQGTADDEHDLPRERGRGARTVATARAATPPATIAPSEIPLETNITSDARCFFGAYSDASPIAFGSAAPSQRPVKKRKIASGVQRARENCREREQAEAGARRDEHAPPADAVRERRERSAPSNTPNRPALNVVPSAPRGRCHAWLIAGATYVMPCTSKPSTNSTAAQRMKARV